MVNLPQFTSKVEICSKVLVNGTEIPVSPIRQFELINDIAIR